MADTATNQNDTTTQPAAAKRTTKPRAKTAAKSRRSTARKPRTATQATPRTQPTATTAPRAGRQALAGVIDAQEKTLTAFAEYQTRAAELTQIPGAAAIAGAQAQLLRGATDAYVSAARSLLK
jgi:hypothetical protein